MKNWLAIALLLCCCFLKAQIDNDSIRMQPVETGTMAAQPTVAAAPVDSSYTPQFKHGIKYTITTKDGIVYTGFVVTETKDFVTIENRVRHESYDIRKSAIAKVNGLTDKQGFDDFTGDNRHADSYMLASSAFLFDESKVTSNYHWLLLENLSYAFTENWAVTANSLAFYPFSIGVKCAFQLDNSNFIGGNIFAMGDVSPYATNNFWGYGGQVKFTHGSTNRNFTAGGGFVGLNSDLLYSTPAFPVYNLSYMNAAWMNRFSSRVALCLEGWYFPKANTTLGGIGIKFLRSEYSSWTLGCYGLLNNFLNASYLHMRALPVPYLGLSQKF